MIFSRDVSISKGRLAWSMSAPDSVVVQFNTIKIQSNQNQLKEKLHFAQESARCRNLFEMATKPIQYMQLQVQLNAGSPLRTLS